MAAAQAHASISVMASSVTQQHGTLLHVKASACDFVVLHAETEVMSTCTHVKMTGDHTYTCNFHQYAKTFIAYVTECSFQNKKKKNERPMNLCKELEYI